MCGIVGFLSLPSSSPRSPSENTRLLREMSDTLGHRGPDDDGFLIDAPAFLGMRRLKIIDLETGKQPISNEDGTISVLFNGEIYNYIELRRELEKKGHTFKTHSDTEVLVHLYEEEGVSFPKRLRGMFAFSIWDSKKKKLVLGRDHFGIKPLFYGTFKNTFFYASELKALFRHPDVERKINDSAIDDFLTLLFIPTPKTAFDGFYKLEPGTVLTVSADGKTRLDCYWNPIERCVELQSERLSSLPDMLAQLESKISECVKLVLRSDVPLGVFLSSGLDSTTIAYFAKQLKTDLETFTIYYKEESYSERPEAARVAHLLKTKHTEIPMDLPENLPEFVWNVLSHFDEPFGDLSSLPTYLLCQSARKHITVAISGDGGDELFGGYPTTTATRFFNAYQCLPAIVRNKLFPELVNRIPTDLNRVSFDYKLKRFINGSRGLTNSKQAHFAWRGAFYWSERADVYSSSFYDRVQAGRPYESALVPLRGMESIGDADQSMMADLRVVMLDQYLVKADMTSMAHSLEVRPALLDPELAELAFRIPFKYKIRGFQTKWILRRLMQGKLPTEILNMPKKGFTPPLSFWLTEPRFQNFVREVTSTANFKLRGIFKDGVIDRLLTDHSDRKVDNTRRLWAILSLANVLNRG